MTTPSLVLSGTDYLANNMYITSGSGFPADQWIGFPAVVLVGGAWVAGLFNFQANSDGTAPSLAQCYNKYPSLGWLNLVAGPEDAVLGDAWYWGATSWDSGWHGVVTGAHPSSAGTITVSSATVSGGVLSLTGTGSGLPNVQTDYDLSFVVRATDGSWWTVTYDINSEGTVDLATETLRTHQRWDRRDAHLWLAFHTSHEVYAGLGDLLDNTLAKNVWPGIVVTPDYHGSAPAPYAPAAIVVSSLHETVVGGVPTVSTDGIAGHDLPPSETLAFVALSDTGHWWWLEALSGSDGHIASVTRRGYYTSSDAALNAISDYWLAGWDRGMTPEDAYTVTRTWIMSRIVTGAGQAPVVEVTDIAWYEFNPSWWDYRASFKATGWPISPIRMIAFPVRAPNGQIYEASSAELLDGSYTGAAWTMGGPWADFPTYIAARSYYPAGLTLGDAVDTGTGSVVRHAGAVQDWDWFLQVTVSAATPDGLGGLSLTVVGTGIAVTDANVKFPVRADDGTWWLITADRGVNGVFGTVTADGPYTDLADVVAPTGSDLILGDLWGSTTGFHPQAVTGALQYADAALFDSGTLDGGTLDGASDAVRSVTQSAHGRISVTPVKTQFAHARVSAAPVSHTKVQLAHARTRTTRTRTGSGTARIGALHDRLGFISLDTQVSDDFIGPVGTNPDAGRWSAKTYTDGASSSYFDGMSEAVLDGDSNLDITAVLESGLTRWDTSFISGNYSYTGPRFVEARAKVPAGNGTWSAPIWEWDAPYGSGGIENDICEQLGSEPTAYHTTLHHVGTQVSGSNTVGVTVSDDFHLYAAAVYADHVDYYFDNQLVRTYTTADLPAGWGFTTTPMVLNVNLAMGGWGGSWGSLPAGTTFHMLVDYVRVWLPGRTKAQTATARIFSTVSGVVTQTARARIGSTALGSVTVTLTEVSGTVTGFGSGFPAGTEVIIPVRSTSGDYWAAVAYANGAGDLVSFTLSFGPYTTPGDLEAATGISMALGDLWEAATPTVHYGVVTGADWFSPPPPPDLSVPARWTWRDVTSGASGTFTINPSAGGDASYSRKNDFNHALVTGPILSYLQDDFERGKFTVTVLDATQLAFFQTMYENPGQMVLTDDLGRQTTLLIESIEIHRIRKMQYPWYHEITMNYLIISVVDI